MNIHLDKDINAADNNNQGKSNNSNEDQSDWRNKDRHKKSNYGSTSYGNTSEGEHDEDRSEGPTKDVNHKSQRNLGGDFNSTHDANTKNEKNKTA